MDIGEATLATVTARATGTRGGLVPNGEGVNDMSTDERRCGDLVMLYTKDGSANAAPLGAVWVSGSAAVGNGRTVGDFCL